MHNLKVVSSLIILLLLSQHVRAIQKKLFVVVDINLKDGSMMNRDSVEFSLNKNDINSSMDSHTDIYTIRLKRMKTRVIIPLSNSVNYGRIIYLGNMIESFKPLNYGNNLFLFVAGDTVELNLADKKLGASFGGKSADKYNCMYEINNHNSINNIKFNDFGKLKKWRDAYLSLIKARDSLYGFQLGILDKYKSLLNPEIFRLIKLDCWADCNHQIVGLCYTPYLIRDTGQYSASKSVFLHYYGNYNDPPYTDFSLLLKSYKYGDYLTDRELAFIIISKSTAESNYSKKIKFKDINEAIDTHYKNDPIKDKLKLLAFYNIDWDRQGDYIEFIQQSITEATNPSIKADLIAFKNAHETGSIVFPFAMPDSVGRIYTINDFKGKLVIVDFWFTGCHGCMQMSKALEPIIKKYIMDGRIAFVSISIDRNKKIWIRSLRENKYTSNSEINLIEGKNGESEFIRFYSVDEYPTLLVISKDGKIASTTPPDPVVNSKAFMDFLDRNL